MLLYLFYRQRNLNLEKQAIKLEGGKNGVAA